MGITRYNANSPLRISFNRDDEVYADTNFLLNCFINESSFPSINPLPYKLAKKLLYEFTRKKIRVLISSLAFNEFWYICLRLLYEKDHGKNTWTGDALKNQPEIISKYKANLENMQEKILEYPYLRIVGVPEDTVKVAFHNMLTFRLSPTDSFHLSTCCFKGIKWFVSRDRDFKRIPDDCEHIDLKIITY